MTADEELEAAREALDRLAGDDPERRRRAGRVAEVLDRLEEENRLFVEELAERYEELSLLTSMSGTLASVLDLEDAADEILQEMVEVTGAARATLWVREDGANELRMLASRGIADPAVLAVSVDAEDSVVAGVYRQQRAVLREGEESLLAVPMTRAAGAERRPLGVLVLIAPPGGGSFSAGDREVAMAVAGQAAAAIENRRLVRESLRRERLSTELEVARELQLGLLPDPASVRDLAQVAARCEPERSVGGDFYHIFRLPDRRLGIMLGDVSSHGVSAALVMARVLSAAGIVARRGEGPAATLRRLAAELAGDLEQTEMHLTLFYGIWSTAEGRLRYASAGHPHAFLLGAEPPRRLAALDPPLGLEEQPKLAERTVEGIAGETLLLFTDGLFEALGEDRSANERRVVTAARGALGHGPEAVVGAVFEASQRERGERADDRTAMAVRLETARRAR